VAIAAGLTASGFVGAEEAMAVHDETWHCMPGFDLEYDEVHNDYDDDEMLHNVTSPDWQHVRQGLGFCGESHTWANN